MYAMQKVPNDVEAQRLLGEVRYEAGDYAGSAAAYRSAIRVCPISLPQSCELIFYSQIWTELRPPMSSNEAQCATRNCI